MNFESNILDEIVIRLDFGCEATHLLRLITEYGYQSFLKTEEHKEQCRDRSTKSPSRPTKRFWESTLTRLESSKWWRLYKKEVVRHTGASPRSTKAAALTKSTNLIRCKIAALRPEISLPG